MNNNLVDNRQIRVFISSTFQDMQDERDYLMKHTFPILCKLASERDVTLTELDLRWGITEEEAKSGKVVEICLREIENSIPFFIGIIGNRYGWVPEKKDLSENVTERFTDVNNYLERHLSVTEMEMQFGVLQRKEDMHAYFYIKEGEESSKADNPEMLERLKKEVQDSKYPSTTYVSPEDLGIQVQQAFTDLLNQLFPEGHLSELEKERIGQRSFLNQLCQNYIRDDKNFQVLDEWMQDWDRHQMVVTGASGLGKSALIANWVKEKLQDENRDYNIIYHFTGNGGSESHHEHITKVLIDEINDVYGWEENTNKSQKDKLNDLFLKVASEGKRSLLIVLDAVNQIIDTDNAKLLNWLPIPPRNIKILFSTLEDDRTMEVFRNRHYPEFVLQPLDVERRRQLAIGYLWLYRKKLTDVQIERIITDRQSENTLVLKTLLDELINYGVFEKLDERIDYYLLPDTIEDFYQALLQSYEEDFGEDFVKDTLSIIAISKNGLTEDEILSITEDKPFFWSQLYCALDSHFANKKGLVVFSHAHLYNATIQRYMLGDNDYENGIRRKIISHLFDSADNRHISEIAWQYFVINDVHRLHDFILDINRFLILCNEKSELIKYWTLLIDKGYCMSEYIPLLISHSIEVCLIFSWWCREYLVDYETSLRFALLSLEKAQKGDQDNSTLSSVYKIVGLIYQSQGKYEKALEYQQKDLSLWEMCSLETNKEKATSYGNIGITYFLIGDYAKALGFHERALSMMTSLYGDCEETAIQLHNVGIDFYKLRNYQNALEYVNKAMALRERFYGTKSEITAQSYNAMSLICSDMKKYNKSLEYALKAVDLYTSIWGYNHPQTAQALDNAGTAYGNNGDFQNQLQFKLKALEIRETLLGLTHQKTAESLNNVGRAYGAIHDFHSELEYESKAIKIYETLCRDSIHPDMFTVYDNLAKAYSKIHDYEKAHVCYLKKFETAKKIWGEKHENTAMALNDIGVILANKGQYDDALKNSLRSLNIRRSLFGEIHPNTARSYCNVGVIYAYLNDYVKCADYITIGASTYTSLERYEDALDYYQKALEIRQSILPPDHKDIQKSKEYIKEVEELMN